MTDLCSVFDLEDNQSLGFLSHKGPVFVVKQDGQPFVYKNECPHLGVNLEFNENDFLDSEGQLIQCSTHGALFNISNGHCLSGPCQGESLTALPFDLINNRIVIK